MNKGNEWSRRLMNIQVPQVDIKEQVMSELTNKSRRNTVVWYRKPQMIIASIVVTALLSGFITTSIIGIHNDEGKLIFSLRSFNEEQQAPLLQQSVMDDYLATIEPGEAIAVYSPVNNPQHIVTARDKPIIYEELDELLANITDGSLYIPNLAANDIVFKQGFIQYELGKPDHDLMIAKSVQNNGETVVEQVPVLDQINGVTMFLEVDNQEYTVSMLEGSRWHTVYTDLSQVKTHQTIATNNGDALLIERKDGQQLLWKSNVGEPDFFYKISVEGKSAVEAEQMVALLQLLIQ